MSPHVKKLLTYGGCLAWAGFALLGLLVLPGILKAINKIPLKPACYLGEDCGKSDVYASLPVPQQEEAPFPMAVDYPKLIGKRGRVVFRASTEWQEAFRALHPYEQVSREDAPKGPIRFAFRDDDGIDKRIADFITAREWHLFHEGHLHNGRPFSALRDSSGEYMLIDVHG